MDTCGQFTPFCVNTFKQIQMIDESHKQKKLRALKQDVDNVAPDNLARTG